MNFIVKAQMGRIKSTPHPQGAKPPVGTKRSSPRSSTSHTVGPQGWSRRDQVDFASLCLAPFVHKAAKSARDWAGRLRRTPALNRRQYKPQNWPFGPPDPPSENKNQIYRLHSGHSDGPIIHEHCACAQATAWVRRFILCGLI